MDLFLIAAVVLLLLGVIGSFTPMVPGALLSVLGVLVYWWSTGYTDPGTVFVVTVILVGLAAFVFDWFAGAILAKIGGASNSTTVASAVAGFLLFFVAGPVGVVVGVAVTVFLMELYHTRDAEKGLKASFYATAGLLASTAVQALITVSILAGFALALIF